MKKLLLTLFVMFAFCGSMFAQDEPAYPSHWSNPDSFLDDQCGIVAAIMIDGVVIDADYENWDALEVAAFIGEGAAEEVRGNNMYLYNGYVEEYNDPFPIIDGLPIYFATTGDLVHFKMYDHIGEIEYTDCTILYLGEELDIFTGVEHLEGWTDAENPIFLSFTTPSAGIDKEIVPYTAGEKDRYYLIASPVGTVAPGRVANMLSNSYDLYYFDQGNQVDGEPKEWVNYEGVNGGYDLEAGKGYLYANSGDGVSELVTLTFPGTANTEAVEVTIENKGDAAPYFAGWNLVGNPYNVDAYINRPFYRMNEGGTEISGEAESDAIHPMEGVFVTTEEETEILSFSTEPSGKVANVALNLRKGGSAVDRAIVRFDDGRQLPKFMLRDNSTRLYIQQDNVDFAVVNADGNGEMPVSFKAEQDGAYTIDVTSQEVGFRYLHLIDNMTGADVDLLATPSYSFDARTTDYASRFKLVFVSDAADVTEGFAFFSNGSWVVANDGEAVLQVVDLNGRVLSSEQVNGCVSKAINAAPGVYMLRLVKGDDMKVQKVVVK